MSNPEEVLANPTPNPMPAGEVSDLERRLLQRLEALVEARLPQVKKEEKKEKTEKKEDSYFQKAKNAITNAVNPKFTKYNKPFFLAVVVAACTAVPVFLIWFSLYYGTCNGDRSVMIPPGRLKEVSHDISNPNPLTQFECIDKLQTLSIMPTRHYSAPGSRFTYSATMSATASRFAHWEMCLFPEMEELLDVKWCSNVRNSGVQSVDYSGDHMRKAREHNDRIDQCRGGSPEASWVENDHGEWSWEHNSTCDYIDDGHLAGIKYLDCGEADETYKAPLRAVGEMCTESPFQALGAALGYWATFELVLTISIVFCLTHCCCVLDTKTSPMRDFVTEVIAEVNGLKVDLAEGASGIFP